MILIITKWRRQPPGDATVAIILLFSGKRDGLENRLLKDCRRLERDKGITAFLRPVEITERKAQEKTYPKLINVDGVDQSGIVYKVSRFLADNSLNIENLSSRRLMFPETGTAIYSMKLRVQVPGEIPPNKFEEGLSRVGEDLNVDIIIN